MPKERISHFITKKIAVTSNNSTTAAKVQPVQPMIKNSNKQSIVKTVKQGPKALLIYKCEAAYAKPPVVQQSQIILTKIIKEATEFREVGKSKKRKTRINPVSTKCPV